MAVIEIARVDASMSTFLLVHSFLAMLTIDLLVRARARVCVCVCVRARAPKQPASQLQTALLGLPTNRHGLMGGMYCMAPRPL